MGGWYLMWWPYWGGVVEQKLRALTPVGGVLSWGPLGSRMRNWVGGQVTRGPLVATMGAAVSLVT